MSVKARLGPVVTGTVTDWIGDHESENQSSFINATYRDDMFDQSFGPSGPNFKVSHVRYDQNEVGLSAYFPETEHFRAIRFEDYIPADIAIGSNGASGLGVQHLTVSDPRTLIPYYAGSMNGSRANRLITEMVAKSNPGRPEVSLPSEVADTLGGLRDLPSNIYQSGKKALRKDRNVNPKSSFGHGATVNFGILPLVSDILKLSRLSELADQRAIELSNLARKGGSRVRKTLFRGSTEETIYGPDLHDPYINGYFPGSKLWTKSTAEVWATTHWIPGVDGFKFVNEQGQVNRKLITGVLLGTSAYKDKIGYLRDAWELIPWSWAADWCGNFGEYLDANTNSNIATYGACFAMQRITTHRILTTPAGVISLLLVSKERSSGFPSLELRVPFLSPQKMSILAEIAGRHGQRGKPLIRARREGED